MNRCGAREATCSSNDLIGGTISRRINYAARNRPPTAVITADPRGGALPLTVEVRRDRSSVDPDRDDPSPIEWDLDGDGQYDDSTAAKPTRTYTQAETITVGLRVSDGALTSTDRS